MNFAVYYSGSANWSEPARVMGKKIPIKRIKVDIIALKIDLSWRVRLRDQFNRSFHRTQYPTRRSR